MSAGYLVCLWQKSILFLTIYFTLKVSMSTIHVLNMVFIMQFWLVKQLIIKIKILQFIVDSLLRCLFKEM